MSRKYPNWQILWDFWMLHCHYIESNVNQKCEILNRSNITQYCAISYNIVQFAQCLACSAQYHQIPHYYVWSTNFNIWHVKFLEYMTRYKALLKWDFLLRKCAKWTHWQTLCSKQWEMRITVFMCMYVYTFDDNLQVYEMYDVSPQYLQYEKMILLFPPFNNE